MNKKLLSILSILVLTPVLVLGQEATSTATTTDDIVVEDVDVTTSIADISEALIEIENITKTVESDIRLQIKEGVDESIVKIRAVEDIEAYLLQRSVDETRKTVFDDIRETIRTTIPTDTEVVNLLSEKISLAVSEMKASLEAISDVEVDFTETLENIDAALDNLSSEIEKRKIIIESRGGDLINVDTDGDGLSDYDEKFIYNTDPESAKTVDGELSDSEKVVRGIDPTSPTGEAIAHEDPREDTDSFVSDIYRVDKVELINERGEVVSSTTEAEERRVRITGTGLPNSYITVYVFSTPVIVTVKTDNRGEWSYTLDKELEDGEHNVYVATVNNAGKILARSEAIPFTKTAEAAAVGAFVVGDNGVSGTGNFVQDNFILIVILIVLVGIVVTVSLVGKKDPVKEEKEANLPVDNQVDESPVEETPVDTDPMK